MKKTALASLLSLGSLLGRPRARSKLRPRPRASPSSTSIRLGRRKIASGTTSFSQGSTVLSYDIFLNLEVAGSQELFRSDANSERYGLIARSRELAIQSGRTAGWSQQDDVATRDERTGRVGEYVGLTCAACHEGQLTYKGKRIRIKAVSANRFDLAAYLTALDDAMQATLTDSAKFDRLAARTGSNERGCQGGLRKRFESRGRQGARLSHPTLVTPHLGGPSRMDAISMIVNRLTAVLPGIPENWSTRIAPTKPPFLWNSPQGLWTQWRGVQQDPIFRNLAETMGVYMSIDLTSKSPAEGLFRLERRDPRTSAGREPIGASGAAQWPEDVFGRIDREKAKAGKALFVTHCSGCHNAWPYTWTEPNKYGKRFVLVGLIPQTTSALIGTVSPVRPFAITGQLSQLPARGVARQRLASDGRTLLRDFPSGSRNRTRRV